MKKYIPKQEYLGTVVSKKYNGRLYMLDFNSVDAASFENWSVIFSECFDVEEIQTPKEKIEEKRKEEKKETTPLDIAKKQVKNYSKDKNNGH